MAAGNSMQTYLTASTSERPTRSAPSQATDLSSACKSHERKVALVKEVEKAGRSKSYIAKEFGILLSTLSTVLKNKQKVSEGFEQSFSSKRKCIQASKFPDVEAALTANCFAHAGFSRALESIKEDIGTEFNGCDELCNEVRKATGCVSDTEDGEIAFEEYALYEANLPVTGMLSDADIVEMAVNDADDRAE
ncbi:hypothetical protein HPB52_023559 [Rhipicephalus sanguineus]|uniref:HTH psq-type domain-containing protein n=1 Tax=Rhipicephalus sanguineus TaxID=34632 RepID=A0A9D4SRM3_RHISA|nr:hypothetical protein HPB52_023559 [Rhipicephalus sanguineus]